MKEIRHRQSQQMRRHAPGGDPRAGRPDDGWLRSVKKPALIGGAVLVLITAVLFVIAVKIALILTGVLLVGAAVLGIYIFLHRRLNP
jgi:drug/metabolite transporter (DMT)-like permease